MAKSVKIIGQDTLAHFGVPGMRWGVRNIRKSVDQKYRKSGGGVAGLAGQAAAKAVLGKHWKNKESVTKTSKAITKTAKALDDKLGTAFGLKKNKAGKWVVTPEAQMKAAAAGVVLGFTASVLELSVRNYVSKHSASSLSNAAAYAQWLANG